MLIHTWIEEIGWKNIKKKLPKDYKWKAQITRKKNRKGRAIVKFD